MSVERIDGPGGFERPERVGESRSRPGGSDGARGRTAADRIELSADARQVAALERLAAELPDVRAERLDALRRALADGTYRVDARQVARALLELEDALRP
jgi:negative regulator of flagellin synthesis FlgM